MDPTNINVLDHSDFLGTESLPDELQTHKIIWWGLAIIELLLSTRLILGYFDAEVTSPLTYVINSLTHYVMYPFTAALTGASGGGSSGWVTIATITGYFLLAITLIGFLKARRSPYSKMERTRARSRRKYSR